MSTQPRFIAVFDIQNGVHCLFPVDFILAIAPLFTKSDIIESAEPVLGRTIITMKDRNAVVTDHSLEELRVILDADMIGDRPLTVIPERKTIVVPEEGGKVFKLDGSKVPTNLP